MKNTVSGSCRILIYGDEIDFQQIENALNLRAERTATKGNRVLESTEKLGRCETNVWIYGESYENQNDLNHSFKQLLNDIYPHRSYLRELILKHPDTEIYLRIYACSDLAQMFFQLDPQIFETVIELGFQLQFSIFSFGMVEGESEYDEDKEHEM